MTILLILLCLALLSLSVVALMAMGKPGIFSVERSVAVLADPETILPWIVDFHRWGEWSPWEKLDPQLERTYSGPPSGRGAVYGWRGAKSGAGSMEILEVDGTARVAILIRFVKPFRAVNSVLFRLEPQGASTFVTWTMSGPNPLFPGKIMDVFLDKDRFLGKDFERGLAALKQVAESPS